MYVSKIYETEKSSNMSSLEFQTDDFAWAGACWGHWFGHVGVRLVGVARLHGAAERGTLRIKLVQNLILLRQRPRQVRNHPNLHLLQPLQLTLMLRLLLQMLFRLITVCLHDWFHVHVFVVALFLAGVSSVRVHLVSIHLFVIQIRSSEQLCDILMLFGVGFALTEHRSVLSLHWLGA